MMLEVKKKKFVRLITHEGRVCVCCDTFKTWNNYTNEKGRPKGKSNICRPCEAPIKSAQNVKRAKIRRNTDIGFKIKENLRNRTRSVLKSKNARKITSTTLLLGIDAENYKIYLESKFQPGMTWDNYGHGVGRWCIDHIVPLSSVDLTNLESLKSVAHYTNTQPMWFIDNLKKSDKILF